MSFNVIDADASTFVVNLMAHIVRIGGVSAINKELENVDQTI